MKNNNYILIGVGALIIGLLGGYLLTDDGRYDHMRGKFGFSRDGKEYQNEIVDDSMMHEGHNMGDMMTGLSERAFLEHMIPHHQEAVDTAKQVVARGENAEVKGLAESIIVAQEKEIADMKSWYKNWYGTEFKDDATYEPMMRDLSKLTGSSLDRAFMEDMIEHHKAALTTNQQVVPNIEHNEIKTLATAIAETQSTEIITMRMLLKQL
jgi:uncharacterized protein (DUF305 family)